MEQGIVRRDIWCETLFLHLLQDDKWIEIWLVGVVLLDENVVVVDCWENFFLFWDWFRWFLLLHLLLLLLRFSRALRCLFE